MKLGFGHLNLVMDKLLSIFFIGAEIVKGFRFCVRVWHQKAISSISIASWLLYTICALAIIKSGNKKCNL